MPLAEALGGLMGLPLKKIEKGREPLEEVKRAKGAKRRRKGCET
jgi:hypothetical protein